MTNFTQLGAAGLAFIATSLLSTPAVADDVIADVTFNDFLRFLWLPRSAISR